MAGTGIAFEKKKNERRSNAARKKGRVELETKLSGEYNECNRGKKKVGQLETEKELSDPKVGKEVVQRCKEKGYN